ncbi:competence ComEA helix-hairpin-helix repeat region domain protein [Pseudarthrobacter siccitolerans]|uniref:Competence ComEA helix-hairpin-helix repeat region domain protein n=1 Tax=Pseudarthrobacter siccitolerans TaxID=861266 RepID=A0A024H205_9MICC|nr:helix-hairpin-helix domain-containing protein [Pseudarthrobacter siccitolerans]CCQ46008.1 competence ComEA helix-hairpin-helix repeat region domain protein [Pseudarthrobacter siccitolerans]
MSRRDAGAAGQQARHARNRLQATLGSNPRGLLLDADGQPAFEYRGGQDPDGGANRGGIDSAPLHDVGPAIRWRLGLRLAVLLGILAVAAGAWFWWQAASGRPEILPLSGVSPETTAGTGENGLTNADNGGGSRAGPESGTSAETPSGAQESSVAGTVVVHVAGAVLRPGVVQLPAGSRVHDALAAAGGGTPGADPDRLNLAAVVEDGQKIHVPLQGAPLPDGAGEAGDSDAGGASEGSAGTSGSKVNLNTAGVEELDGLPKVGPVLAQRIVDWRKEHGPFKAVEELDAIDGVGPKMLEALLPLVTV